MKIVSIALFLMASAAITQAEPFGVKHNDTGKTFGPFETSPGSLVVLGSSTFTVVRAVGPAPAAAPGAPKMGPVMKSLHSLNIPEFEVRSALPEDCLMFVRDMIHQSANFKDVNIVTRHLHADPFSPDAKTVTCSLKNVSAYQALHEVCQQAELAMTEEDGMIVVQPKK